MNNYVTCENTACGKRFKLTSPDGIIEARTYDDTWTFEVTEREYVVLCGDCKKRCVKMDKGYEGPDWT